MTSHPPFIDGGCFGSPSSLSLGGSYVPSYGCTCGGSPDPEEDVWVVPATRGHTPRGSPGDLTPPILQWGVNWLSVIFIPCSSIPSFWRQHGGPSFSSSPSPHHHGGSSNPSSHYPCHHGGSSFSSFSIGIMRALAGSLHWQPVLGGSASTAIPPSVTHEVQDVSSLVATPLANVRVLPLSVSSHPSLLGSSRGAVGKHATNNIRSCHS